MVEPRKRDPLTAQQAVARDRAVAHVKRCAAVSMTSHQDDALWLQRRRPEPNVVSILGGRGTGKTTVMEAVLAETCPTDLPNAAGDQADKQFPRLLALPILDATVGPREDSLRYYIVQVLEQAFEAIVAQSGEVAPHASSSTATDDAEGRPRAARKNIARRTLDDLTAGMIGGDPEWRRATAHLSATQWDFARWSDMRAEATVGFSGKFDAAVAAFAAYAGCDAVVLPIDDVDLAPQRFLDVLRVLNELRFCRSLIILVAADGRDGQLRLAADLLRDATAEGSPAVAEGQIQHYLAEVAPRMLAKLLPERYRSELFNVLALRRPWFPSEATGGLRQPSDRTIGNLLVHLGVSTSGSVWPRPFGPMAPWELYWGSVLPPTLRGLAEVHDSLEQLRAKHEAIRAQPRVPSTRTAQGTDWMLRHRPTSGSIAAVVTQAVAIVARMAGAGAWANELDLISREAIQQGGYEEAYLLLQNFDLDADPPDLDNPSQELVDLRNALATGSSTNKWLPLRLDGALAAVDLTDPGIEISHFGPLGADLLLRYRPVSRFTLPLRWRLGRAALNSANIQVIEVAPSSGESVRATLGVGVLFQLFLATVQRTDSKMAIPLGSCWSEMIELLHDLGRLPTLSIRFSPSAMADFLKRQDLLGTAIRELPSQAKSVAGYVGMMGLLLRILLVRRDIARWRKRRHDGEERLFSPDDRLRETGIWFSDCLEQLSTVAGNAHRRAKRDGHSTEKEALDTTSGYSKSVQFSEHQAVVHVLALLPPFEIFDSEVWRNESTLVADAELQLRRGDE